MSGGNKSMCLQQIYIIWANTPNLSSSVKKYLTLEKQGFYVKAG